MSATIHYRDGTVRTVEWPMQVTTEPGWLKLLEHYTDESFGDMGISGDREIEAIPSDLIDRVTNTYEP